MAISKSTNTSHAFYGHAHPPPTEDAPCEVLQTIIDSFNPCVQLRGLAGNDRLSLSNIFCPDVRRSEYHADHPVNHLDVVSCWKGLGCSQAQEIEVWEILFHENLGSMVFEAVLQLFQVHLGESLHTETIEGAMIRFMAFLDVRGPRLIPIDVPQLVYNMIEAFNGLGFSQDHSWFTSSRNLPAIVCQFLQTHDCFTDSFPSPCLEATLHLAPANGGRLSISGQVKWFPPNIDFNDIPSKLASGTMFMIRPNFMEQRLVSDLRPQLLSTPAEITFYVNSTTLSMAWDKASGGFRVYIPFFEERSRSLQRSRGRSERHLNVEQVESILSGTIVRRFPGGVLFEQTTRYSIKLSIEESFTRNNTHATAHAQPADSQTGESLERSITNLQKRKDWLTMLQSKNFLERMKLQERSIQLRHEYEETIRDISLAQLGVSIPVQSCPSIVTESTNDSPLIDLGKESNKESNTKVDIGINCEQNEVKSNENQQDSQDQTHNYASPTDCNHDSEVNRSFYFTDLENANLEKTPSTGDSHVPQKRKAPKQCQPATFWTPTAFETQSLALDKVEQDPEDGIAKRQKFEDDDIWDSVLIPNLADATGELGEAPCTPHMKEEAKDRRDHEFEIQTGSHQEFPSRWALGKGQNSRTRSSWKKCVSMPVWKTGLKTVQNAKRSAKNPDKDHCALVHQDEFWPDPRGASEGSENGHTPLSSDSGFGDGCLINEYSASASSSSSEEEEKHWQADIKANYEEFLSKKSGDAPEDQRPSLMNLDGAVEERKAFERIFLADSGEEMDTSDPWNTDAEDLSDLTEELTI